MFVMRQADHRGISRRQVIEEFDSDEEEFLYQFAYRKIRPFPEYWEMWAILLESQVQQPNKKFNFERHLPFIEKATRQMSVEEIRSTFATMHKK